MSLDLAAALTSAPTLASNFRPNSHSQFHLWSDLMRKVCILAVYSELARLVQKGDEDVYEVQKEVGDYRRPERAGVDEQSGYH